MGRFGPEVTLNDAAFVHPTAHVYGKVTLERGSSLWPYSVIRAEAFEVVIGPHSNVQDFAMIHVGETTGTYIGAYCSITHHCTIHGARLGDNCLVSINVTIMDGCEIGENCIIAGGAYLPEGTVIPDNSVVMGVPGKVVRNQNNWVKNRLNAWMYVRNSEAYAAGRHRSWDGDDFARAMAAELARLEEAFAARSGEADALAGTAPTD